MTILKPFPNLFGKGFLLSSPALRACCPGRLLPFLRLLLHQLPLLSEGRVGLLPLNRDHRPLAGCHVPAGEIFARVGQFTQKRHKLEGKDSVDMKPTTDTLGGMARKKPMKFSDELRRAVSRAGVSQNEVARRAGLPKETMSRFVRGFRGLTLENVDRLVAALGLRLVGPEDDVEP